MVIVALGEVYVPFEKFVTVETAGACVNCELELLFGWHDLNKDTC